MLHILKNNKRITVRNLINFSLYMYIISIYLFTYVPGYYFVSNIVAAIFILTCFTFIVASNKKIVFNIFMKIYSVFMFISLISLLVAVDKNIAFGTFLTMTQLFLLMFAITNYVIDEREITNIFRSFSWGGLLASIFILVIDFDINNIQRFGDLLGNLNDVGRMLAVSSIFSIYLFIKEKKFFYFFVFLLTTIVVILTGSRFSFIFLLIALIITLLGSSKSTIWSKMKILISAISFVFIVFLLIYRIPLFYNIIGYRIDNVIDAIFYGGTQEGSINHRYDLLYRGWGIFKQRPFLGYGPNNFRVMNLKLFNDKAYSHNNIIELLVGVGLFGTILFYYSYFHVLKENILLKQNDRLLVYCISGIIIGYFILSFGTQYYLEKHIAIIISVSSMRPLIIKRKNCNYL